MVKRTHLRSRKSLYDIFECCKYDPDRRQTSPALRERRIGFTGKTSHQIGYDAANKVQRQITKSAAANLLESRIGEQFDAIVTGASGKGMWVRILNPPIEGRLMSGFEGLDVGRRFRVQLVRTNVDRGHIDFKNVV